MLEELELIDELLLEELTIELFDELESELLLDELIIELLEELTKLLLDELGTELALELTEELLSVELELATEELSTELLTDELEPSELATAELTAELATELTTEELATELEDTELLTELLDKLLLELETATPQFSVSLVVVLLIVFVLRLITILVQPLAGTSAAGNASVPQPPFGSTLKRAPPVTAKKLRQILISVIEPTTSVNKSPSAQLLCVPRKWYLVPATLDTDELELIFEELLEELDFAEELDLTDELNFEELAIEELTLEELLEEELAFEEDDTVAAVMLHFFVSVKNLIVQVPAATEILVPLSPPTP